MTDIVVADESGFAVADPSGFILGFPGAAAIVTTGYTFATVPFYAADITVFRPGGVTVPFSKAWGMGGWGSFSLSGAASETTTTINVSDLGYRTESPVTAYPPYLADAFQIDAKVPLDPGQVGATWAWGTLKLVNADNTYDALAQDWNSSGRAVTIYWGLKTWEDNRGIFTDPNSGDLEILFAGVAGPWRQSETMLEIPLRDNTYRMERRVQGSVYAGTGTYEGDPELTGTAKPMARGVTLNIPGTLIDRANLIIQFTDARCTIDALYENGGTTITFQADTTNLYSGTTSPGQYRTDKSRGLVQLGSSPVGEITADVTGEFPSAGLVTTVVALAQAMMTEQCDVPSGALDTASFAAADAAYPYQAGIWIDPSQNEDGVSAVMRLLSSIHAKLAPARDGKLICLVLRAIPVGATPVASYDATNILVNDDGTGGVVPVDMPAAVNPPPFRVRVAYRHNHTVQTSTLSGSITAAQRQFVAQADRFAAWSSGAVALAYANQNDLAPFGGCLTQEADAQAVANEVGALFEARPLLFDVPVEVSEGLHREIGDVIMVKYPNYALSSGKLCQVTGRSIVSTDQKIVLQVMTA